MKSSLSLMQTITVIAIGLLSAMHAACDETYREVNMGFDHQGQRLSGSLILPKNKPGPFAVVVFVHGDGAMPYDAYGYYRPLWQRLADQGIASFSWDKPGVNRSQGAWESQSMEDRADEVTSAIAVLKRHSAVATDKIGLIGFSQAGWVLPLVASQSDEASFMIFISTAVNWMAQGAYDTRMRLTREGLGETEIKQLTEVFNTMNERFIVSPSSYEEYLKFHRSHPLLRQYDQKPMSPQRFKFAQLNWHYDANKHLETIKVPTLALFGGHDVHVDVPDTVRLYRKAFAVQGDHDLGNRDFTVNVFPDAQHSLLKQHHFGEMDPGIAFIIKLEFLGEAAFADGFLDYVVNWLVDKAGD